MWLAPGSQKPTVRDTAAPSSRHNGQHIDDGGGAFGAKGSRAEIRRPLVLEGQGQLHRRFGMGTGILVLGATQFGSEYTL